MGMARTAPITPLTQYNAYDEERKWSTSRSLLVYVTFSVDLFEIYIFITWYSLFEHMFCLELGKVCKTNA